MTGQNILAVLGIIGVPTLVTVLLNFLSNRATLKRTAGKTDAEADEIAGRAQVQIIQNMRGEMTRLEEKADRAVAEADKREVSMNRALAQAKQEFTDQMAEMKREHDRQMAEMKAAHRREVEELVSNVTALTVWAQTAYEEDASIGQPPIPKRYLKRDS